MVKIEPGKNVEVKIYNDEDTIILNKDNINKAIIGDNFKVKSNGDIMIYFYGRLFNFIKQIVRWIIIPPPIATPIPGAVIFAATTAVIAPPIPSIPKAIP